MTRRNASTTRRTVRAESNASSAVFHLSTITGKITLGRELTLHMHWRRKDPILSPYQPFIKKRPAVARALALLLLIGLNVFNFTNVSYTQAYFADTESTKENNFETGKLDIVLSNTTFEGVVSPTPDDVSQFTTNVSLISGSLDTHYDLRVDNAIGTLCPQLTLEGTHGISTVSSSLTSFATNSATSDFGLWDFSVALPSETPPPWGESCEFDIVFSAWLLGYETLPESGFYDEEIYHIIVNLELAGLQSPIVINEFLPNPQGELLDESGNVIFDFGKDSDNMPQGEWVELYNLTGEPVDLTNWHITDASGGLGNTEITGTNTLPATTIIAAHGFLVVYMNKPVWNNEGDTVKLYDGDPDEGAVLRDSYAYTDDYDFCELTPTPGGENDEVPGGGADCGGNVPDNKSYARIPDGIGAFVDPVPTPGFVNTLEEISAQEFEDEYFEVLLSDNEDPEAVPESFLSPMTSATTSDENASTTEDVVNTDDSLEESSGSGGSNPENAPEDALVTPDEAPAKEEEPEVDTVPVEESTDGDPGGDVSVSRPEEEAEPEEVSEPEESPEAPEAQEDAEEEPAEEAAPEESEPEASAPEPEPERESAPPPASPTE